MPLEKSDWTWLSSFSSGAIKLPAAQAPATGSPEAATMKLEADQMTERKQEQARKQVMIAAATARLEAKKEDMRAAFQIKVEVYDKKDGAKKDAARKAEGKEANAKTKTMDTRAEDGDQRKAFDTKHEGGQLKAGGGREEMNTAQNMMGFIVKETDELAKAMTDRSYIDPESGAIVVKSEALFTAKEISDEIYAPMVREKVIGENFVPNKFSGTQRMLDGSNEHYINECKEKGKRLGVNKAEVAKSTIALAAALTTTALSALAPVADGKNAIAGSGKLSKEMAARASEITTGIAALLTTTVDIGDQVDEYRTSGNFSEIGFKKVANGIGLGIGRIIAGSISDTSVSNGIGMAVTDGIATAVALIDIGPRVIKWMKTSEPFPWSALVDDIGEAISTGMNVGSDLTSSETSNNLGVAGASISSGFKVAAKAVEAKAVTAIRNGEWKEVFGILTTAGVESAKAVPASLVYVPDYNEKETFADQTLEAGYGKARLDVVDTAADQIGKALPGLAEHAKGIPGAKTVGGVVKHGLDKATTRHGKHAEEMDALFEEKKKKQEAAEQAEEMEDYNKKQKAELADYQLSLDSLGSSSPTEAEYKSIAKLIKHIETDRAIWTAITTIASGGIAVAQEFVPGLKIAGELVKYIANIKAAADRLKALLDWKDARKDAQSAVSAYASSIENMIRNQSEQLTHYSLQAAANAIKALVAVGELTPYAPAFKVTGAAIGLAATTEELIYKAYKQAMLVRAWSKTQKALQTPDDRKLGLMAREMNPTLAKYTIAFGAMIEHDQVAITACERIGLDRECLARAGDKVPAVKDFMQTLYVDDNIVIGQLDAVKGKTKVPPAALTAKAWSVSHLLWVENDKLQGANPSNIVAGLTRVMKFEEKNKTRDYSGLSDSELAAYRNTLLTLYLSYSDYVPQNDMGMAISAVVNACGVYADLAAARQEAIDDVISIRAAAPPLVQPAPSQVPPAQRP